MVLEVVELVFIHPAGSELARTRLALVRLQVMRIKPLCTAGLANKFRVFRTEVGFALVYRPVLQLITFAASELWLELRLTFPAHQARVFPHVELDGAELLRSLLALVVVLLARHVSSLSAAWPHEVYG